MKIILKELPKVSLNQWYSGKHWANRKKIKDNYKILIKSQFKNTFDIFSTYKVSYSFFFKQKPLDASNCVAMVKLIEDVLFHDDNYKIISEIKISSKKDKEERVEINVTQQTI